MRRMMHCGVEPNAISYSTVIYAHARLSRKAQAEAWFQQMREAPERERESERETESERYRESERERGDERREKRGQRDTER